MGRSCVAQPGLIVPVRVGVPPATEAARPCPARDTDELPDTCVVTSSLRPDTVSTFPARPDPSFGVFTGSATAWLLVPVAYRCHFVPNSFWAFPMLIVAPTRRCVTSTVAVTP